MVAQQEVVLFPQYQDALKELVEQHKELEDWPLVLAIYYAPERQPEDIFLFEVVQKFGEDEVNREQELFEVQYGSTAGFQMRPGQFLHLVMANSAEVEVAVQHAWKHAVEIRNAMQQNKAIVLFGESAEAKRLEQLIRG